MNGEIYHNHELGYLFIRYKISVLPILIYRFNEFPNQSLAGFFCFFINKMISRLKQNYTEPKTVQKKIGRTEPPDFNIYYKYSHQGRVVIA